MYLQRCLRKVITALLFLNKSLTWKKGEEIKDFYTEYLNNQVSRRWHMEDTILGNLGT